MRTGAFPDNPLEAAAMAVGQYPAPLFEGFGALATARCVMAGVSLGIFEALEKEPADAQSLAQRLDLDPAGAAVLLEALHALRYLDCEDGAYRPRRQVRRHLRGGAREDLSRWTGDFGYDMWDYFSRLEQAVRSGEPEGLHDRPSDDPFWERYMRGLFDVSRLSARHVAAMVGADEPDSLLDLAGGHGGFAMEMCRRHPGLRATVLELEGSARIGERIAVEEGMSDRVDYEVGDIFESDLGGPHDVVMANSIAHHLPPERNVELASRARDALRPGGLMAIYELEAPAPGERAEAMAALTSMLFFITSQVRNYSGRELAGFLGEAGYGQIRIRRHRLLPGTCVVVGRA